MSIYDKTTGMPNFGNGDPEVARRMRLADMLYGMGNQPIEAKSPLEGLAKMATNLVNTWSGTKQEEAATERHQERNKALADALRMGQGQAAETKSYGDGTTINWNERKADPALTASLLSANPMTADVGMQMQMGQAEAKAKAESDLARTQREHDLALERISQTPIRLEDGSYVIPGQVPGYGGSSTGGQPPQHPAAPSVTAAKPATQTTGQPTAMPGVDQSTSTTAPNPPPVQLEVPAVFQDTINAHAERTGLPVDLLGRVFMTESGGRPDIVSGQTVSTAGAEGPMQVMPGTQRDPGFGVTPAKDGTAEENFRVGSDYLAAMVKKYGGNVQHALMAYNWGPGNVDAWLKSGADLSKVPAETRKYVARITPEGAQPPAVPGGVQVADASDGSVRSDVKRAYDTVVRQTPEVPAQPSAPGSVRADVETAVNGVRWEGGRLVGGQGGPKVRNLSDKEVQDLGYAPGTKLQQDRDGKITLVQAAPKAGENVDPQTKKRAEGLGELQSKTLGAWKEQADSARATRGQADRLLEALDNGLKTGSGPAVLGAASKALQWFGIPESATNLFFSTKDEAQFNAASNELVLSIVKSLGPNPSNADREFIERTVPTLRNSPEAVRGLVDFMKQKGRESEHRWEAGYKFYKDGGDPLEFDSLWANRETRTSNGKTYYRIGGEIYEAN
jgi:soluble lytic murein transglycosylase-like protein